MRRRRPQQERDQGGRTPLHDAAVDGEPDDARRLLAAGSDVEAEDLDGTRPLHVAAMHQHPEVLELLLEAGAEVDPRDARANTPLFYATTFSQGSGDCIVPLLRAGADPHASNRYGSSPVTAARTITNVDLARWYEGVPDA